MAYIDKITAINSSNNESEVFDIKDTISGYTTNTGTVTKVTVGSDLKVGSTAGGNITTTGTITHANSVTAKATQALYPIKYDAQGHITGSGTAITDVSYFTNDAGYITAADVPEGSVPYTGTIQPVSTAASSGTNNGFARGDHVHNITKTTIDSTLGTGSGTTKFYREDGSWATPNYIANTDEKLKIAAVTSGTTYYPIVAANSTTAATRQYDATGLAYAGTNGTTSAVGTAKITLGNNTASGTANNKKGQVVLYGSTTYATTIDPGSPTAARTITLPNNSGTVALTSDIPTVPDISGKVNITETNGDTTTEIVRDSDLNLLRLKASSEYGEGFVEISTVGAYISSNMNAAISVNSNVVKLMSDADDLSKPNLAVNNSSISLTSPSIVLSGLSSGNAYTLAGSATVSRTLTLPDKTGTIALTSDIPTISYPVTSVNTKTGAVNLSASDVGAAASSHAHGNITSGGDITATAPTIASGDQIIINDHSASKITNGPTFDGSTTTKALTPKGTWETFSKFSGSYNDLSNKPTIPTVPTNISAFTNDAGYITSADVPEGASAYTGTISAVGTAASSGTNNGFARGDHTHNITKTTIDSVLGTGSGTTKFYREDGTWVAPTDNDTKNTAGSTNTSSKIFLIGATSQAANPQTYSHDTAYVGTDGKLYSASKVVLVGGSNAASTVTITPTTTDVYSMTSAGSVTAGTKASFTRGTFSQGTLPAMTWAMDTTDTKKLNITFSQGTLPTHAADSFTANTPTAVTLPGRSSAIKAWTGYSAATAAAQAFTGVTA